MVFNGTKTTNVTMDITKVQDVEIAAGYTGTISIAQGPPPFGAASTLEVTNSFKMLEPAATVYNGGGVSTLKLSGASIFTWSAGTMRGIDILLGSSTDHAVTGTINSSDRVVLIASRLVNHGTFTWMAGHITVPLRYTAEIVNEADAIFEVQAAGLFVCPEQEENVGKFTNRGLLKFNTTHVGIHADFANDGGTVRVYPGGQVSFSYKAEQTGGTFDLRGDGATVKVLSTSRVLGIRDGLLTGAGTIDGNLNLGYDGGPATAVTIRPGIEAAVGTITITQSWQMFSSSGQTWIRVLDDGSYSEIVATSGWAKLAGVLWVENSPNYKPAHEKRITFLTAGLGFDGTDFAHRDMTYWGSWADPVTKKPLVWRFDQTANTYSIVTRVVEGSGPPGS